MGAGNDEAPKTAVHLSRAAVELTVGAWDNTERAPHEILHTLMGHHAKGVDRLTFLVVDGDGLVYLFHSLFCITGGKHEERPINIWAVKGEILAARIPMLVKLTPLHFELKLLFRGTDQAEFEIHTTSLSSVHSRDLDATSHQLAAVEDEGSCVMSSCGITSMPADVTQVILEVSLDGVAPPISEFACQSYGLLMCSASRMFDCSSNWMQVSFTTLDSGAYL